MRKGGTLTYLHTDQLGSTVLETAGVNVSADQRYFAFGKQRDAGPVVTDYRFTGQKEDGTGLVYMNARYYDPALGQFISPDTILPDATNVLDYNRYMYVRGNPLKYNDPSGHQASCMMDKDGNMECNANPTIGGKTVTSATTVDLQEATEPPPPSLKPAFVGPTCGNCTYGCDSGIVLIFRQQGEVYGKAEIPTSPQLEAAVPAPGVGQISAKSGLVTVMTTKGESYLDYQSVVMVGLGPSIGVEHSGKDGFAPVAGVNVGGHGFQLQVWKGQGEVMLQTPAGDYGVAGSFPQTRIFATSGWYLDSVGGLEGFRKKQKITTGYELVSTEVIESQNGYAGWSILQAQVQWRQRAAELIQ